MFFISYTMLMNEHAAKAEQRKLNKYNKLITFVALKNERKTQRNFILYY